MNTFRKTVFASLAAASIGVVALPAAAIEPVSATDIDDVLVTSEGFDLGGPGFAGGEPTSSARVEWQQAWFGSTVTFNGTIHFDEVSGECARVRLISYDSDSVEMSRAFSTVECARNNGYNVSFVSVQGQAGASEVQVLLQRLLDNGEWVGVGGSGPVMVAYGPMLGTSEVSISRASFDAGTGDFVGGTAASPATVTWTVAGSGLIKPTFSGTLYMKNTDNLCGRMRCEYINNSIGAGVIEAREGTPHCVTDSDLHTFPVTSQYFQGVESSWVDAIRIIIQSSSRDPGTGESLGNWVQVGSTTAYLPSVIVPVVLDLPQTFP